MDFLGRAKWMTAEEQEGRDLDYGNDRLRFGELFKGIKDLIDIAAKLSEEIDEDNKTGQVKFLTKQLSGVYGLSVRPHKGQSPFIETFGNIRKSRKGPVIGEVREPIVDILDEKSRIVVIAELPGVSEEEINIDLMGDIINLHACSRDRKYGKKILLPRKMERQTMKHTFKNGILKIKMVKAN
jgi:HSP20 family protein